MVSSNERIIIILKIWIVNALLANLIFMSIHNFDSIHEPLPMIKETIFFLCHSLFLIPFLYFFLGRINKSSFSRTQKIMAFIFVAITVSLLTPFMHYGFGVKFRIKMEDLLHVYFSFTLPFVIFSVVSAYFFSRNYFHSLRIVE